MYCLRQPYLVLLHHALDLVADGPGVVGDAEVRLLAELVPADAAVVAQLLLQACAELPGVRRTVQTALLRRENVPCCSVHVEENVKKMPVV